jgi:hypothetical protein
LQKAADTCWTVAAGLGLVDTVTGAYFQTRGYPFALESGDPVRIARGVALEACFAAVGGSRVAPATAQLIARAERLSNDDAYATAWVATARTTAASLEGRWADAAAPAAMGDRLFESAHAGAVWERTAINWMSCYSAAYLGDMLVLESQVKRRVHEAQQRGDIYSEVAFSTAVANLAWLLRDGPDAARDRCKSAMSRWSQASFQLAHFWALLAECHILLYEGKPRDVVARLDETKRALENSLLLRCQLTQVEVWHLRARALMGIAAEGGSDSRACDGQAARLARLMLGERTLWGDSLAKTVLAGVAAREGNTQQTHELLVLATQGFETANMALHAAATRVRLAEIATTQDERDDGDSAAVALDELGVADVDSCVAMVLGPVC